MRKNKIILNHLPPEEPDDKDKIPTKELILSAAKAAKDTFETERNYQVSESVINTLYDLFDKGKNVIKNFNANILYKYKDHIFSPKHINNGILKLGKTKDEILIRIIETIKKADNANKLKYGHNEIKTIINYHNCIVRLFINNGEVMSINAFVGETNAQITNSFFLP